MSDDLELVEEFQVRDLAGAEWVMRKIMEKEAEVTKQKSIKAQIVENCDSLIKEAESSLNWTKARFAADLEAWFKENEPKKARSIKTPFGSFGYRKSRESVKVLDEEQAIWWLAEWAGQTKDEEERERREKVAEAHTKRTEKLLVKDLPRDIGWPENTVEFIEAADVFYPSGKEIEG